MGRALEGDQALYFRDQFRIARAAGLRDAECFSQILLCIERLGAFLTGSGQGLGKYKGEIVELAEMSPLARDIPACCRHWHTPFDVLYDLVRRGRNTVVHEGAYARHLANHAGELALILEDALMDSKYTAREFMVENPVCASLWEPVSFIRQRMLLNSFSFLPVLNCGQWGFICETSLARYLRRPIEASDPTNGRKERLAVSLREAIASGQMELDSSEVCIPSTPIDEIVGKLNGSPILVVQEGDPTRLLGILTAYDLL